MERHVTLGLETFAQLALEEQAQRHQSSPEQIVREAVLYFLADLRAGRPSRRVPAFARLPRSARNPVTLRFSLDARSWSALLDEAERQRISLDRLIVHALLYYLSDLESGRATLAVLEELGEE